MRWFTSSRRSVASVPPSQKSKKDHRQLRRAVVEAMEGRTLLTAYHLTFSEEFNALNLATSATDTKPWSALDYWNNHYVGIDQQYYSNPLTESYNPFTVANGSLSIKAQPTPAGFDADGRSWVSGEITTAKRNQYGTNPGGLGFSQKYGYFEMRAKLPLGSGFFPAFWLMPLGNNNAEYDIMEGLGNNPDAVYQTQHWSNYSAKDGFTYETVIDTTTGYHTYGFEWNASTVNWYVDGVKTKTGVNHSNEAMYILVNLAIGGWNNNVVNAQTNFNNTYDVDYVRVYSSDPAKPAVTPGAGYSVNPNTLPITVNGLEDGFNQADIGAPGATGSGSYNAGVYTIAGSGTDIGGTSDKFRYASKILTGDGTLTARLTGLTGGDSQAKAGVMLRTDWSANAPFASLVERPGNQVTFQYRATAGAAVQSTSLAVPTGATYLRLTRNGNVFSGFYSTNGSTWSPVAAGQTITMGKTIQAGMAVTSHVNTSLATATFDTVSVTPALLERTGWVATASHSAYSEPKRAIDGELAGNSVWLNGQSTTTAMWFNLDLGSVRTFQRATLLHDGSSDKQIGGYLAYTSTDGTTWTPAPAAVSIVGRDVTIALNSSVSTRYFRLMPNANYSDWWSIFEINLATVPAIAAAPPSTALPAGWTGANVGAVGVSGTSTYTGGTFTVTGAGADIGGGTDAFNFASTAVTGDQTIVARVTSLTNTHASAKAGVMFRDSTHVGAPNAAVVVMPTSGVRFQYRAGTGQWTNGVTVAGVTAPTWVKLVRSGSTYSGYYATVTGTPAASDWVQIGTPVSVTFANSTYRAGLAVTSRNTAALATGTFTNVSVGGTSYFLAAPATTTLSRAGWTATASSTPSYETTTRAIDGSNGTRWSTGQNPLNGWFQVDMGSAQTFRRFVISSSSNPTDYIRGYAVYVSNNGTDWSTQTAIATGTNASTVLDVTLASPVTARYVRVVCTSSAGYWWGITEFNLYN